MSGYDTYAPGLAVQTAKVAADSKAIVTATGAGDTALVAAQGAGVKILVLGFLISSSTALAVKFRTASTDLTAPIYLAANSPGVVSLFKTPFILTAANEALNINLSIAGSVGVTVLWRPTV